jgi:ATP-binding cassette, subfamily D (ALD), member 3
VLGHAKKLASARWFIGVIDQLLVKYIATIVGYSVVSIPVFWPDASFLGALFPHLANRRRAIAAARSAAACKGGDKSSASDAEDNSSNIAGLYTRNSRLLLQLAGAIGRLVVSSKEVTRLTGYAQRVSNLRDVLKDLSQANAIRNRFESSPDLARDLHLAELMKPGKLVIGNADDGLVANNIRFENVNIMSPDSICLVEGLTLEIPRHCHVLIAAPNGAGKSSFTRVLAGLWPLYGGTMYRPPGENLFYVPQRPYLALGTLRDNLVYPSTWQEAMEQRGATDYFLIQLLEQVHLEDLVRRKGGLDAVQDWSETLSGGQKQRLGFARLLFHKPIYAILDEASVSSHHSSYSPYHAQRTH